MNNFTLLLYCCHKCKSLSRGILFRIPKLFSILVITIFFGLNLDLCFAQISRTQIISNASSFVTFNWTANTCNLWNGASCGGRNVYAATPTNSTQRGWVKVGTNSSMPYAWGGYATTAQHISAMASCKSAGDICSAGSVGGNCSAQGNSGAGLSCTSGLDCSGFVTRAWGLSTLHLGTGQLPDYSTSIPLSQTQPGDILNDAGSHVRLVETNYGNGNYRVIESSGTDWKTAYHTYTAAQLASYDPRCPNSNIVTGGCGSVTAPSNDNCSSAILLTSSSTCNYTQGTIDNATDDGFPTLPSCNGTSSTQYGVFYKFIATSTSALITVNPENTSSSGLDAVVVIYSGTSCTNLNEIACLDPTGKVNVNLTVNNLIPGNSYWIRIYDWGSSQPPIGNGGFSICVTGNSTPSCTYSLSQTSKNFPYSGGSGSFTINATAGAGCNWDVSLSSTSEYDFANFTSITNGTGPYTINYTIDPNPTTHSLSCSYLITGNNGYSQEYVITQDANTTCDPTPSATTANFTSSGGSGSFNINVGAGCYWNIYNSCSTMLTNIAPTSGTGPATVTYNVLSNNSTSRNCQITIQQNLKSHKVTQEGNCTVPISPTSVTASQTTITTGQSTTLQEVGGTLNSAPDWIWYTGNCGGTQIGTGATISVSPTTTTTYYVQASACGTTTTCKSVTINVTNGCTAPLAPASCTTSIGDPANGLVHKTNLSCDIVSGADGYFFEYSYDGTTWNTDWGGDSGYSWVINLSDSPNFPIYYRVRSYKCDPVKYSESYTYASPQPIYTACDAAAVPTINGATSSSLNVTLNAETPEENPSYTTYSIFCTTTNQYVQTNGTLASNEVFQTKSDWGTKKVTGLLNYKEYCFYAKAKNGNDDVRFNQANSGCATTLQGTASPNAPVALAASGITQTGFTANWNASATATGYRLDVAMDNAFTNYLAGYQNKDVGNVTTLPITGLITGTTYYYRVKAYNSGGTSGVSNIISVKTLIDTGTTATLTIGNTSGAAGSTISIPVSATNFLDIVAFQFTIVYDKNKLDYVSCSNWATGTNVSDVQVNPLINDGKITFVYNNSAINITAGKFFDINFTVKSNATGTALFSWSDTPTKRELSNSQSQEVPGNYDNGTLTIVSGYNLSGQLLYENTAKTLLNNISIALLNSNSQSVVTSTTDASGSFSFPGLSNGNYTLKPDVKAAWGGASAMDITSYKKHIGNVSTLSQIQVKSGDVNGSNSLTSMDLTIIKQRIGAQINSFNTGDWVYDPIAATINGTNLVQNIKALCYGDANGSYTPSTLKSFSNVFLAGKEKISLFNSGEFEMPFKLNKTVNKLSSVTLSLNYPFELFEVKDVKMIAHNEDLYYSVNGGKINVVYSTLNSLDLNEGDLLLTIRFSLKKVASQVTLLDDQLEFIGSGEFGDYDDKVINEVKLSYATFDLNTLLNGFRQDEIKVYPNPATNLLTVTNVDDTRISVIDMLGRSLLSLDCQSNPIELDIRSLLPGTYTLKINKNDEIIYRKFNVVK